MKLSEICWFFDFSPLLTQFSAIFHTPTADSTFSHSFPPTDISNSEKRPKFQIATQKRRFQKRGKEVSDFENDGIFMDPVARIGWRASMGVIAGSSNEIAWCQYID
jgi:hypothetical protein